MLLLRIMALSLCLLFSGSVAGWAQDAGEADLNAAFEKKVQAKTIGDFEDVVELCRSAIKKGLDGESETEAKMLASSALYEHAEQLMVRIRQAQQDPTFFRNEAMKRLREATELNDEMVDAWMMIATLNLLPGGDQAEARSAVDRAIGLSDEEPAKQSQAYLMRSLLVGQTDKVAGREDLDKAVDTDDMNLRALRTRSNFLILEGDVEAGIADSDRIVELSEGNENMLLAQADSLNSMAIRKLALVERLKAQPDDAEVPENAPSVEELETEAKSLWTAALKYVDQVVELNPDRAEVYLLQSRYNGFLENEDAAMKAVETMLEKDKKSIAGLLQKAQLLLQDESKDEQTEAVLDRALNLDPYNDATLNLRRRFFLARGQYEKAIKATKKIAERNPGNVALMANMALLYSLAEQPDKAVEIYSDLLGSQEYSQSSIDRSPPREGLTIAVGRMSFLRSRGDAYLSLGEHENAIEDYEEGLEIGDLIDEMQSSISSDLDFEGDDGILNNLAWVLSTSTDDDLRNGERAVELATRACEITNFQAPHIISTLASAYAESGDFDKAIEWIEKGLEVNEKKRAEKDADAAVIDQQKASLEDELKSYKEKKPWRENQVEEMEAKAKAAKEKAAQEKAAKEKEASDKKSDDEAAKKSDDDDSSEEEDDEDDGDNDGKADKS